MAQQLRRNSMSDNTSNDDQFRTRASTFKIKQPTGLEGYVLKIKADALKDLIAELSTNDYGAHGATLFLNVFENDSEFNKGEKYLSSTISPIPTEEQQRPATVGSNTRSRVGQSYGNKVRGRN